VPPFVVTAIVLAEPTAKQLLVPGQTMLLRDETLVVWPVHVVPPLEVTRMPPFVTDTQQWLASGQLIPVRAVATPEVCAVQVVPPFVVATTVPPVPTTQQTVVLTQLIALSVAVPAPDVWPVQVVPPFTVARIMPLAPTAKQ
jgi:hypothetical protein